MDSESPDRGLPESTLSLARSQKKIDTATILSLYNICGCAPTTFPSHFLPFSGEAMPSVLAHQPSIFHVAAALSHPMVQAHIPTPHQAPPRSDPFGIQRFLGRCILEAHPVLFPKYHPISGSATLSVACSVCCSAVPISPRAAHIGFCLLNQGLWFGAFVRGPSLHVSNFDTVESKFGALSSFHGLFPSNLSGPQLAEHCLHWVLPAESGFLVRCFCSWSIFACFKFRCPPVQARCAVEL